MHLLTANSSDLWFGASQTVLLGQPALECTGSWLKYRLYFRPKINKNWTGRGPGICVCQTSFQMISYALELENCCSQWLLSSFWVSASSARQSQPRVPVLLWFSAWRLILCWFCWRHSGVCVLFPVRLLAVCLSALHLPSVLSCNCFPGFSLEYLCVLDSFLPHAEFNYYPVSRI